MSRKNPLKAHKMLDRYNLRDYNVPIRNRERGVIDAGTAERDIGKNGS